MSWWQQQQQQETRKKCSHLSINEVQPNIQQYGLCRRVSHGTPWNMEKKMPWKCHFTIRLSSHIRSVNIVALDLNAYAAAHKNNLIFIVLSQLRHQNINKTHSPKYSTFWKLKNFQFGKYLFIVWRNLMRWKIPLLLLDGTLKIALFRWLLLVFECRKSTVEWRWSTVAEEEERQPKHSIGTGTALANVAKWFI